MKHWRLISWASLALVLIAGCSSEPDNKLASAEVNKEENVDSWLVEWTDPTNETPAHLSNGKVSVRIGRDGTVVEGDGFRRASTFVREDQTPQSDSLSSGMIRMSYIRMSYEWTAAGVRLEPKDGQDYRQSLDLRTGVLETSWKQTVGDTTIHVTSKAAFIDDLEFSWSFLADHDTTIHSWTLYMEDEAHELKSGEEYNLGNFDDDLEDWLESRSVSDIEIEGSVEDERAIRSMLFYLRSSFGAEIPPGPMGLSNDTYNGHIFWDSDVWMFPALAFVEPNSASKISRFRIDHLHEASMLADSTLFPPMDIQWGDNFPARYPWESDVSGRDVTEGPTKKGDHQSGGVAWSLDMASALGLVDFEDSERVGSAVANYYKLRLAKETNQAEIHDVKGVDEWFEGDNGLYTNVIADWTIKKFLGEDVNMYYPRDEKGLLAYDGDNRTAYKQAAAPLILWPLEREDLVDDPIAFLDMFEGKEAPNGPAMSLSIYALIRARYGDADTAYETWRESWKRYTDGNPLMLFSEIEGRADRTYFLTGAAGCLNAVIYGFIGVRIVDEEPIDDAKLPLENGKWLVVRPNLPKAWKSVTFHGMQLLGEQYTVVCKGRTATITKL